MDSTPLLLQALVIGFAIAATFGPIGLLCVERTLRHGLGAGLATGLGVALADGLYCALVGFGAASLSELLLAYDRPLGLAGGLGLILLGLRPLLRPRPSDAAPGRTLRGGTFVSAFLLTMANPLTIVTFVAVFAGLGLVERAATSGDAAIVIAGVFFGSLAWWICLSLAVAWISHRLPESVIAWINRISGVVLIGFGLAFIARVLA